ncbi:MAG: hypothetical protein UU77_C0018G0005 [candidate division WWE3 bacterium GW2011_GWC1_41_7]|uniref:Uncharacterized protein n=3 Tax=Katanobacteria TaxID=422282 RepID=A0A0G0X713_UNCKA|nr:MAG: hypothetical protein UU72_C0001G0115 [candidate division WWE3 bacterium GW2011_GWB1_41_6]KKS20730.1 MAG: hypothetical protein UU77_C0018G0005 [candidate division WWE3 bacterium GW2011_GWC1_41_7]OGC56468.1 MAG: hypothetical protein A2976_01220 [candidate division WWE3 bacterium RIFCSPLOWO2_01_FULL_41_9]
MQRSVNYPYWVLVVFLVVLSWLGAEYQGTIWQVLFTYLFPLGVAVFSVYIITKADDVHRPDVDFKPFFVLLTGLILALIFYIVWNIISSSTNWILYGSLFVVVFGYVRFARIFKTMNQIKKENHNG